MGRTAVYLALLACGAAPAADDPVLPPPRVAEPVLPPRFVEPDPLIPSLVFSRVSAYEVWQNRAVNRRGYFVARVVPAPYGHTYDLYYRYNGEPYLTPTTKPYDYMPYASD
jgi:hypothetical protein